ncbi:hypothetical protein ES319_A05G388900v1 [Gossypium barbadense]|uniref:Uncharacterized protein n=3 Tax=Gossypium TaxID=3633 RepID=A0A5J5W0H3_GOSBA|nr:hypothetical protein ES319_A05G388900v1 [Gossypium barbadense]TYH20214.1 hypothetical protein ES288_A05G413700v1 [Gossypium darwinii]TYI30852.1 hypothetical protein ES332_A05G415600v1 [Gossypium tomentosum]
MEACFLSSNSFTKSLEIVPSIKARSLTFTKKNPNLFHSRKVSFPSSITCCHLDSSSPSDDDKKPTLDSDWHSSSSTNPDTVVDHPPSVAINDKWVHTIHEPEKGCLLIATEKLDGVHIFERTVILLLSTGPIGPSGIILNRPSLMSIKEMRSPTLDIAGTFSDRQLFFGGPLEEGLFLVTPRMDEKSGVFEEVMEGLYYGTKESAGCAAEMVKRNVIGAGDLRFFDGYYGWEKGQLNEEIRAGYWTIAACSPNVIGLGSVASVVLWDEIIELLGPKKVW